MGATLEAEGGDTRTEEEGPPVKLEPPAPAHPPGAVRRSLGRPGGQVHHMGP